jgi:hypothetical protein
MTSVKKQVWRARNQVLDQVLNPVGDKIWVQVWDQLRTPVSTQIQNQVTSHFRYKIERSYSYDSRCKRDCLRIRKTDVVVGK